MLSKINNKLVFTTLVLVLLGSLIPPAAAVTPVNGLAIGDKFTFDGNGHNSEMSDRFAELNNATDGMREFYHEEGSQREIIESSTTDISIIKDRPVITVPFDTALVMDTFGQTEAGSFEEYYNNRHEYNESGMLQWYNFSDYRDLTGEHYGGGPEGDDPQYMTSNATYALIFPEMMINNFNIGGFGDFFFQSTFDGNVPLTERSILSGSNSFTINGASQSINFVNVSQTFSVSHSETFTEYVVLGDQNDPNAPGADMNVTLNIDITLQTWYVYDTATTMVIGVGEASTFVFSFDILGDNISLDFEPQNPDNPVGTYDFTSSATFSSDRSMYSSMTEASAMYGNTRASSSGNNELEEGDLLKYHFEQNRAHLLDVSNSFGDRDESEYIWAEESTEGILNIDVFRHQSGFFEALVYVSGNAEGSFYHDRTYYDQNNQQIFEVVEDVSFGPTPIVFFDLLEAGSSADTEIQPGFPDFMWFEDAFRCDGPDCGDEFYPMFPHEATPTTANVNVTDWEVDLVAEGEDPLVINGNNFYYFNVTTHQIAYERVESSTIQIPIGGGDGGGEIWVDATMDITYEGIVAWHYDSDTGAMVAREEGFYGEVHIYGNWDIDFNDGGPMVPVSIDATLINAYGMSFFLMEHPYYYSTGQEIIDDTPEDPPANESDNGDDGLGLDLPLPIAPIVFSVSFVAIIARRRRN